MTPNSTFKIEIIEGRIKDLSAVLNGTQVLGINTVRFESDTLPATGKHVDWITPILLLLAGFTLLKCMKFYLMDLVMHNNQY